MDLTIRDWMVIVGVLLIMAVLLDAWRRVRSERYSRVKLKLAPEEDVVAEREVDLNWLKELPNGGARVVARGDMVRAARGERSREPVADQQPESITTATASAESGTAGTPADDDEVELMAGVSSGSVASDEPESMDWLDGMGADGDPAAQPSTPDQQSDAGRLPRDIDPEVFMLNVIGRKAEGFRGEDILHILLACDLRFGDMNFFHRHEFEAGRGAIQFSVANMMQPGVFDIDNMSDMTTPGLVFFLTLPGPEDMMKAFDYMLETAQAVARNLGGDVLDESRSVMTKQTMDHCRQQIRDLERRLLAKAH